MQILWKLKSFCKEVMAEITKINHTTTPVDYVIWRKGYVAHNATEIRISITLLFLLKSIENVLWVRQLIRILIVHTKNMVSFFAKEEKISAAELREI
jgi:predicted transcriptional regulator